ncbi:ABC transporter ATP-binding protein [Actinotalea sp. BY-33]|uniref:ABC transporter ATP-binding protein n=1 Tax=Actinotalea soli TaxID=2819234 RepID=A0A939LRI6_9CELL|nr:ABC transporter ATP-binding protein [Actinotalea soli]MBO1753387.1 ABC transporter ATP-binding protein [Actinotalea soli]
MTSSPAPVIAQVEHLAKSYGGVPAVTDVSLELRRGEILGVLGPNGAGKTTTVECLTGLRVRDAGRVEVLGLDPARDGAALRQRVGCQLQESELPAKLRAGEALDLYGSFYDDPADGRELAARLGLGGHLDTPYAGLSGGQKQRLSIALALVGNPEVAVLDELTTGLDPQARRDTWDLIEQVRDDGVTIVLVTHFMDEAERLCDRVVLIDQGEVVATDTPAGLIASVQGGQVLRLRLATTTPRRALDEALQAVDELAELRVTPPQAGPETSPTVVTPEDEVVLRGGREMVGPALLALARAGLEPVDVAAERMTLEDAFVTLTGRTASPSYQEA